ncbi:helix-turn-helix transcriptional regulator [Acetobacterium wieringae]|uniref:helix-turn-helix domain-containing protein n=1 Tax=Acetobacterium wieringae TaxID=52694 RepID=UPI003158D801
MFIIKKSLSEARVDAGYTQEEMSKLLNIGTSTYNQYETGARNIPAEIVDEITNILKIEKSEFFLPAKFTLSKLKAS